MAAAFNFAFLLLILFTNSCLSQLTSFSYQSSIPLKSFVDCIQTQQSAQFFDISKLDCVSCSQNLTFQEASPNGQSCVCKPGYKYLRNFGGTEVLCQPCGADQVVSKSGYECVFCPNTILPDKLGCTPCGDTTISPERDMEGNLIVKRQCLTCANGTRTNADNSRCEVCTNKLFNASHPSIGENCACTAPYQQQDGFCFPQETLPSTSAQTTSAFIIPDTEPTASKYFQDNLLAAYAMCNFYKNDTACQLLGNLCVLTLYQYLTRNLNTGPYSNACEMHLRLPFIERNFAPPHIPWLFYVSNSIERIDGEAVLKTDKMGKVYTFDPRSYLDYRVARYSLSGEYLGLSDVLNGRIQLCKDTTIRLNAAFTFGTTYKQTCKMDAIDFWDQTKYPVEFMDLYLEIEKNSQKSLFPVPVNILNYKSLDNAGEETNRGGDGGKMLVRRFFMVDNVGNIPANGGGSAQMVRYAKSIKINVNLVSGTTEGFIYPPALDIEYGKVSKTDADGGSTVDISFEVTYTYDPNDYKRDFRISIGVLSTLGVLYAGYKTWCWSKRSGRPSIDFQTIVHFFFFCSGTLANVFFVVTFGMAFYWLIFYKRQSVVYLVHPTTSQLKDWLGVFVSAFALKFLEVAHMIFMQCMIDVFFIDWERPKGVTGSATESGKSKEVPVSIWRTYFVANEWNEIQAIRKINKTFQVWAVVFFLVVVGFENTATKDPDGSVNKKSEDYRSEYSHVYRYALAVLVFLVTAIVQWIFFTFVYERFFEDKVRQFVDLCSMSNISVFIMAHAQWGHYIHGRSVHGKSDTNMKEMFELIKKEEEDNCSKRGLLPNDEQQTFMMAIPRKLRQRYETIRAPAQLEIAQRNAAGRGVGGSVLKQVEAYNTINRLLCAFIDRSMKECDYVVRPKNFLESLMDTEFDDTAETGIFYNDDGHSFDRVLFYGNEFTLIIFDMLTFCVADLIFQNYIVAGVITYILCEIVCMARNAGGQKNLAKKTLVDERFLI
ncbi:meckelin-like isoform X2 [Dreissena polymorpha]|uniref:meckelin-like isoform X2 n=1 Tax=Dreissena polymorpha TaxID=45954 RepID=UPI0022642184|nr:meckelin-like isoform X2 [Dreissena polymorpha]